MSISEPRPEPYCPRCGGTVGLEGECLGLCERRLRGREILHDATPAYTGETPNPPLDPNLEERLLQAFFGPLEEEEDGDHEGNREG